MGKRTSTTVKQIANFWESSSKSNSSDSKFERKMRVSDHKWKEKFTENEREGEGLWGWMRGSIRKEELVCKGWQFFLCKVLKSSATSTLCVSENKKKRQEGMMFCSNCRSKAWLNAVISLFYGHIELICLMIADCLSRLSSISNSFQLVSQALLLYHFYLHI